MEIEFVELEMEVTKCSSGHESTLDVASRPTLANNNVFLGGVLTLEPLLFVLFVSIKGFTDLDSCELSILALS